MYDYGTFKGTTKNYGIWLDMNEPSVFSGPEGTLPKNSLHHTDKGMAVYHRDVHNIYGLLHSRATFYGLLSRNKFANQEVERPFILTRSAYLGTQKYAAKWTGDNQSIEDELNMSIS